jgi:dihydroorotate dehydrogenase electron transfer subunit
MFEHQIMRISSTVRETPDITTLYLEPKIEANPGQYLMVWIPGVDEIPMSLSTIEDKTSISVRIVGDATKALAELNQGDRIGVRGPLGTGYSIEGLKPLIIGGGSGIASLAPLAEKMVTIGLNPTLLIGARSSDQLLFKDRFSKLIGKRLKIATDDGTEGYHGYVSNLATTMINEMDYDSIYACGPELMIVKVFEAAERMNINIQVSMERLCKCAIGLCGSCAVGPFRVCKDGPIFDIEMLRAIKDEFGKLRMDASGREIKVEH